MKVNVDIFDYYALRQSRDFKYIQSEQLKKLLSSNLNSNFEERIKEGALNAYFKSIQEEKINTTSENHLDNQSRIKKSTNQYTKEFRNSLNNAYALLYQFSTQNYDSAYAVYFKGLQELQRNLNKLAKEIENNVLSALDDDNASTVSLSNLEIYISEEFNKLAACRT